MSHLYRCAMYSIEKRQYLPNVDQFRNFVVVLELRNIRATHAAETSGNPATLAPLPLSGHYHRRVTHPEKVLESIMST